MEFDPTSETHHPLLIIKLVEPGCTTELQIENCLSGEVTRLTTTEDAQQDEMIFCAAVLDCFKTAFGKYHPRV